MPREVKNLTIYSIVANNFLRFFYSCKKRMISLLLFALFYFHFNQLNFIYLTILYFSFEEILSVKKYTAKNEKLIG